MRQDRRQGKRREERGERRREEEKRNGVSPLAAFDDLESRPDKSRQDKAGQGG
jgi:hypothetical protein